MLFFWTFLLIKESWKKESWIKKCWNEKYSISVFNIDNNKNQISILEWSLKDHVTLKTGVMVLDNSALHHRNRLYL